MNPKMSYHITRFTYHPFENKHVKKIIDAVIRKLASKDGPVHICDPFCNDKTTRRQGTTLTTNDLNPKFKADYNLEANDFGELMERKGRSFDLILFDPPYSLRQLKEQYEGIGKDLELWQTKNMWGRCKDALLSCVAPGGYVISFGWHTSGFGRRRGFEVQEIHVLNQGSLEARYDLLVTVEKKITNDLYSYEVASK